MRTAPRLLALTIVALIAAACGGAASVVVDQTASPAPKTPAPTTQAPAPSASAGAPTLSWVISDKSKATVTVREQLAALPLPSDAVLVASGAKGSFQLNDDGSFADGSQITCDVSSLTSDQSLRDNFVKQTVLGTRQFPTATFVPTKATGLTLPLAASGRFTFKLVGKLTIHGVTKDVTFDVDATRSGGDLKATATLNPTFTFEDFGMPQPAAPGRVLSVVDQIHLTIDLIAAGPAS